MFHMFIAMEFLLKIMCPKTKILSYNVETYVNGAYFVISWRRFYLWKSFSCDATKKWKFEAHDINVNVNTCCIFRSNQEYLFKFSSASFHSLNKIRNWNFHQWWSKLDWCQSTFSNLFLQPERFIWVICWLLLLLSF